MNRHERRRVGRLPLLETDLLYGDLTTGTAGRRISFAHSLYAAPLRHVRGLPRSAFRDGSVQLSVSQGYQRTATPPTSSAQSFQAHARPHRQLTSRSSLLAVFWGGVTVLGAVDSIPLDPPDPMPEEEEDAGQGVSTGPRFYDYGPGTNFGGYFSMQHDGRAWFVLSYRAHHLHVLDGVRANHFLQHARADLTLPLRGRLGAGVSGEFFDRRTYYQEQGASTGRFRFPQLRVFMSWSAS